MNLNILDFFNGSKKENDSKNKNKFNQAFLKWIGATGTHYDTNGKTYVQQGYNANPTVYAVINQQAKKSQTIPFSVRKVIDQSSQKRFSALQVATEYKSTPAQAMQKIRLQEKAFDTNIYGMPFDKPNPLQDWKELIALYKTFMKTTGNCFFYIVRRSAEKGKGEPVQIYVLPAHLTQIVLKEGADLSTFDNPIKEYLLTEGDSYVRFDKDEIIHVKYPNPNYSTDGAHLYGIAPLRSALRNLETTNEGLDLNVKTMKNGGAYGFIHGKNSVLTQAQADSLKDRLVEMDEDNGKLGKIAGSSAEVGFTRIALSTAELQPFEFFKYDEKQLCNVLNWSDKLLNNDGGSNYGAYLDSVKKQVIIGDIMPDLMLLADSLNTQFFPMFGEKSKLCIVFDPSELPEMQEDTAELVKWLNTALDRGVITRNEYRKAINYVELDNESMNEFTVQNEIMTLKGSLEENLNI